MDFLIPIPSFPFRAHKTPPTVVMQETYSHEVSSCGFWPGGGLVEEPAFYAYAYPEPQGFKDYSIQPSQSLTCPKVFAEGEWHNKA